MVLVAGLLDISVFIFALVTNGRLVGAVFLIDDYLDELVVEELAFLLFERLS